MNISKPVAWSLVALAAVTTLFLLLPEPVESSQHFVIGPVRVFDGDNLLPEPQYVEVQQGLITGISPQRPNNDAPLINGKALDGKALNDQSQAAAPQWLLPGLIDAHVHSYGNAQQQQLSFGVTSAIDLFSAAAQLPQHKSNRNDIRQASQADIWSAGTLVTAPKGHGTEYGMTIPVLASAADAAAFVAARQAEGADFIKIVYQSEHAIYKSMPSISHDSLKAVIAAAHQAKLKAVVHIAEQASALEAVEAGADGLVHSFFDSRISERLLQALKQRDVFVIPTMTVYEAAVRGTAAQQHLLARSDLALPVAARAALGSSRNPRIPAKLYQNLIDNTRAMHQAGIRLLAGTDAPNPGTYHGLSMLLELALLQEAGLSFEQALHCATAAPAQAFDLPQRGRIAVGYRADFLLTAALQQPSDLLTATIFKNGQQVQLSHSLPTRAAVKAGPLADFSRSDSPLQGASFVASSDLMMQGKSSASLLLQAQSTPAHLQVSGHITAGAAYPWAGLAWSAAADYQQGLDFSAISQLKFRLRGTPGRYRLLAFSEGNQRPAEVSFTVQQDWQDVEIPLQQLQGIDPSRLSMLVWSASAPDNLSAAGVEFSLEFATLQLVGN